MLQSFPKKLLKIAIKYGQLIKSCLFFAKENKTAAPKLTEYRETSARRKHINFDRGARLFPSILESKISIIL